MSCSPPKPFMVGRNKFFTLDMLHYEHTKYFVSKALDELGREGMASFPHFMFFTSGTIDRAVEMARKDGHGPRPMWDIKKCAPDHLGFYTHHYIASLLGAQAKWVEKRAGAGPFTIEQAGEWIRKLQPDVKPRFNESKRTVALPGGLVVYTLHELAARTGYTHDTIREMYLNYGGIFKGLIYKMPMYITLILPDKYRQIKELLLSWPRANRERPAESENQLEEENKE